MPEEEEVKSEPEQQRFEHVILHTSGSLPGIPGQHGAGSYVIDWQERTIHPAESLEAYLQSLAQPPALEEESGTAGEPVPEQSELPPALESQPVDALSSLLSIHPNTL